MVTCDFLSQIHCKKDYPSKSLQQRCLIVLLLLISVNVQPNSGPDSVRNFDPPAGFKSRSWFGFIHLNVCSLIAKMDMIRIWALSTDADVIVLSETYSLQ